MNDQSKKCITVFISYSWDNEEHTDWVLGLADLIDKAGASTIVDRKHLPYGGHIKTFMISNILKSDIVLIILTPKYKRKAESLKDGAGYEYNIINNELFKVINTNDKFIPIVRGPWTESVTDFLKNFNCVDLNDGGQYQRNLKALLKQITKTPATAPSVTTKRKSKNEPKHEYKDISLVTEEMKKTGIKYFERIMEKKEGGITRINIKERLQQWEESIEREHKVFVGDFNPGKMGIYKDYPEDFKNKVFARKLWTVNAALKTSDPDLTKYKVHFKQADNRDIFNTVNRIIEETDKYAQIATNINYTHLTGIDALKMGYLDEENMLMERVIGIGIRSEILHRYHPAYFAIMTQPSMWAMYFLCESADEFITIDRKSKAGKVRVSHNWQYPYARFTFLMNALANMLSFWIMKHGFSLRPHLRFGYVNKFLSSIHELHKEDIRLLHQWIDIV